MKICGNCSFKNEESSAFCINCGAALENVAGTDEKKARGFESPAADGTENPVLNAMRERGFAALMYITTILFGIMTLLGLFSFVKGLVDFVTYLMSDNYYKFVTDDFSLRMAVGGITFVPGLFMFAGMVKTLLQTRKKAGAFDTSGLSVINTVLMMKMAFGFLVLLIFGFTFAAFLLDGGHFTSDDISLFVYVAFLLLAVLYYVLASLSVKNVKRAIKTGKPSGRTSVYVVAVNIILAFLATAAIVLLSVFSDKIPYYNYYRQIPGILDYIAGIAAVLALIVLSAMMLTYNSKMKALRTATVPPYIPAGNNTENMPVKEETTVQADITENAENTEKTENAEPELQTDVNQAQQ